KAYCHQGDPEDDKHLRERIIMIPRIGRQTDYQFEADANGAMNLSLPVKKLARFTGRCSVPLGLRTGTRAPTLPVQHRFDGKLRHQNRDLLCSSPPPPYHSLTS